MNELKFPQGITPIIKHVKKGEVLLRNGEVSHQFYYVQKGCLRSYSIDSKGKEHILQFAPEDWVISDQESAINNTPALLNIDALEDSTIAIYTVHASLNIAQMDKKAMEDMLGKFQKRILVLQKRIILLMSATAQERYNDFNTTYPNLAQRLPLKIIASYLAITPESLSRVRKELVARK
jgi:CRP-like cAMP-binding protein